MINNNTFKAFDDWKFSSENNNLSLMKTKMTASMLALYQILRYHMLWAELYKSQEPYLSIFIILKKETNCPWGGIWTYMNHKVLKRDAFAFLAMDPGFEVLG